MKTKSAAMRIRAFDYEIKSANDTGHFSGYGSVFDVVDSYNEVVAPGAFVDSLDEIRGKGRALPVLWQHRSGDPIGNWDMATLNEDKKGLAGDGQLWLEEAPYARIAQRGMKSKAITGLSIGYYVRDSSKDQKTGVVTLKRLDLVEISIVTNPANEEARIDTIKAKLLHGSYPTVRECEELLREQGFSRYAAATIANRGYQYLLDRGEPASEGASETLKSLLCDFSIHK